MCLCVGGRKAQPRFNPHPTRRLGAIGVHPHYLRHCICFNPHPTRRLGAISTGRESVGRGEVSILTQPEGWVPFNTEVGKPRLLAFQSSPNPKVGCHGNGNNSPVVLSCFNPHPTRRLGAMLTSQAVDLLGVFLLFSRSPLNRTGNPPRRASRKQENR